MSPVARVSLLGAFVFSTLGFVTIGVFLGPELPAGATPFYLLAGICAVAGVIVWSPWNAASRIVANKSRTDEEPDESDDPRNIDLTKLTSAGCLLYLASACVALGVSVAFVVSPEGEASTDRARKAVAGIGLLIAGGLFYGGRWGLQRMGIPLVKRRLKKLVAKKRNTLSQSSSQTSPPRRRQIRPPE